MRKILSLLSATLLLAACAHNHQGNPGATAAFIPADSANKMINSYLNSINYQQNDTDLRSLIIDGNAMRSYLISPQGQGITNMKIMFAHTLDYINSGRENQPCGMRSGALTVVIAGYNPQGEYVYYNGNTVLDHSTPCPNSCPAIGQAAQDTLTQTQ